MHNCTVSVLDKHLFVYLFLYVFVCLCNYSFLQVIFFLTSCLLTCLCVELLIWRCIVAILLVLSWASV